MTLALKKCLRDFVLEVGKPERLDLRRIGIAEDHLIAFFGAERDVASLTRRDSRDYRAHRLSKGVTDSTIRRELGILKSALSHAAEEERIDAVPVIKLPPESAPRERWLTLEEVERIMEQPMAERIRLWLYLAIGTGARSGAIETLPWGRVDFKGGFIDFRDPQMKVTKKRRAKLKMADFLRPVLEAAKKAADARGEGGPGDLVIGRGGSTREPVKRVMCAAGIDEPGVCRHVFRRTFVMWALLNKASFAEVGAAIGDRAVTLENSYTKFFPEHTSGAVDAIHLSERKN